MLEYDWMQSSLSMIPQDDLLLLEFTTFIDPHFSANTGCAKRQLLHVTHSLSINT